jgi:hypothetical protein
MGYLKALFTGWVNGMGTILTLAAISLYVASDVWHKNLYIPPWIALLVAMSSFIGVSYRVWKKEWLRAETGQRLYDGLKVRCDDIILGWKELAERYQNAPKEQGQSATLPNPMDPGWVSYGFKVWPYKVGELQGKTNTLRCDLVRVGITVEQWDYAYMTMAQLLHALDNYRTKIH